MATLKQLKSGEKREFKAHNGGTATVSLNSKGEFVITYKTKGYKSGDNSAVSYKSTNVRKTLSGANNSLVDFGARGLKRM